MNFYFKAQIVIAFNYKEKLYQYTFHNFTTISIVKIFSNNLYLLRFCFPILNPSIKNKKIQSIMNVHQNAKTTQINVKLNDQYFIKIIK